MPIGAPEAFEMAVTEAFVEVEQELRTGDRIQFIRNNRRAGRNNGDIASAAFQADF